LSNSSLKYILIFSKIEPVRSAAASEQLNSHRKVFSMHPTIKQLFKLVSLLLIGVTLVVGMLVFYNLNRVSIYNQLVSLDLIPKPEKMTELYFNDSANLPSSETSNQATGTYIGTVDDLSSNVSTSLSLTGVRQSQGKITGYLVLGSGLQGSGPLSGTIDAAKHLQLTVTDSTGHAKFFFEGAMQSAISLSGDYYQCSPNSTQNSQCSRASSGYGIWSLVLALSFAFVIHNLETTDYQYAYQVSVNLNGTRHIVDSGIVLVKNNQYYVKNETFNLMNSPGRQEVVVELTNKQQSIDFWVKPY